MHRSLHSPYISVNVILILGIFSLACSISKSIPTQLRPTSTRQSTATQKPLKTFTSTSTPTQTNTPTITPTRTSTFTPTFTNTPTATKTPTPTATLSPIPSPTLTEAESLLLQAETAMQSVHTLQMDISLTTKSGILPVTLEGTGIAERPDKVYISLSLLFQTYEVLSLGEDEVFIKYLGSDTWERTPVEQMDLSTSLLRNAFTLIEVSDTAIAPRVVGMEQVNGVTCYHLTLDINLPLYLNQRAPGVARQFDLITSRARGELWIGTDDFRIQKLYNEMELVSQGESIPVTATIEFTGFNEPVVFPEKPRY